MHTIKLLLTYYLNISVQAANLSDCRMESNRIETFFYLNWNAFLPLLLTSLLHSLSSNLAVAIWPPVMQV